MIEGDGCHLHHNSVPSSAIGDLVKLKDVPMLSDVHHVGLIVADREKALAGIGKLFAGQPFRMDAVFPPARFRTGIATTSYRLGFVWAGNLLVEVLQPTDDQSIQGRYLKERGEGLHHLGFIVPSIDAHLKALGGDREEAILADGTIPGNDLKWVYLDSQIIPGVVVELIERSSAAEQFFEGIYNVTGGHLPA